MEAATVAWHPLGFEPVGFSEIEPFPCAILKHRFPNVKNYGDLTQYQSWDIAPGTIDLLVGGTPCQSFSVAGLRKGLADPRGNLSLVFLGLADKLKPRWIVWENVPGFLSADGGRAAGSFLGALAELGYGWAYRILDAQHFGVPQRRRRVFVVACLGDQQSAAKVLFEPESLPGDSKKGLQAGEETAGDVGEGAQADGINPRVANTLQRVTGDWRKEDNVNAVVVPNMQMFGGNNTSGPINVSPCITSHKSSRMCFHNEGFIVQEAYRKSRRACSKDDYETWVKDEKANTINLFDISDTRTTHAVACDNNENLAVRRLTPLECERLQGFPDNWSRIPWRGRAEEDCPDGPRYKVCGNSMAVPVMRWIGERIKAVSIAK